MHRRLRPVGNQFAYDAFSLALPFVAARRPARGWGLRTTGTRW